jgi:hypothetical protein
MNIKIILSLTLMVVLIGETYGQRRNNRRNRNRGRKDQCHLREMEACINKMQQLGKGPDPTSIIATSDGLNRICKTIREDMIKCVKSYTKKCGTPLHREVIDLVLDQITGRISRFCKEDNPLRKKFLSHSPCMHQKVLSTEEYKTGCNNNFLAVVDRIDDPATKKVTGQEGFADDTHSSVCCGYVTWHDCTTKMIQDQCGDEANEAYKQFLGQAFGTLTNMACPADLFPVESDTCKKLRIVPGTKSKGKLGDNALTKYVTSMFSFLFITSE